MSEPIVDDTTPMEELSIAEMWRIYRDKAVPKHAHATQIHETQKAFYAGAICILTMLKRIGEDDIPEDLGVTIIDRLDREGETFVSAVSGPKGRPS